MTNRTDTKIDKKPYKIFPCEWREVVLPKLRGGALNIWLYRLTCEGDKKDGKDRSWHSSETVRKNLGMAKSAYWDAHNLLVDNGWLIKVGTMPSRQGKDAIVYRTAVGRPAPKKIKKAGSSPETGHLETGPSRAEMVPKSDRNSSKSGHEMVLKPDGNVRNQDYEVAQLSTPKELTQRSKRVEREDFVSSSSSGVLEDSPEKSAGNPAASPAVKPAVSPAEDADSEISATPAGFAKNNLYRKITSPDNRAHVLSAIKVLRRSLVHGPVVYRGLQHLLSDVHDIPMQLPQLGMIEDVLVSLKVLTNSGGLYSLASNEILDEVNNELKEGQKTNA